jgi:cell division initiation protein
MIDLTPLEVRQKKGDFRRALRGYDAELVDDFLDLVADRMEDLVRENLSLREAARSARDDLAAYRQKEQALSDALMAAQKLRDDTRQHAEKEGELLLREARQAAQAVREEAARQIVREEEALRQVRARRAQLVESFRRLLERELAQLSVIEETLELGSSRSVSAREHPTAARSPNRAPVRWDEEIEGLAAEANELEAAEASQASELEAPKASEASEAPEEEVREEELEAGGAEEVEDEQADWLSPLRED